MANTEVRMLEGPGYQHLVLILKSRRMYNDAREVNTCDEFSGRACLLCSVKVSFANFEDGLENVCIYICGKQKFQKANNGSYFMRAIGY